MNHRRVSVCIANFNGANVIDACIYSILKQTTTENIEIIIHDDASHDDSVNIISNKYPSISLITSDQNVGFCVANNRMANVAQGEYLLFLNNDAELFEDAIDTLLTAASSSVLPTIYGLPQYDTGTHQLIDCGAFVDPFFNAVPNSVLHQQEVAMVAGACLWMPKQLWDELGGFPEWFESMAEDLYLCCRARLAGYPVTTLPMSGFYHLVGNSFGGGKIEKGRMQTTYKRRSLSERNKLFTLLIIMPVTWLYFLLPLQIVLLLMEGMLLALFKMQWRIWADIYAPLIPSIYLYREQWKQQRRNVQQRKRIPFRQWLRVMHWQPYKVKMLIKYGVPEIK